MFVNTVCESASVWDLGQMTLETFWFCNARDLCSPDDYNDAIKDVVGVLDIAKGPVDQNLQQHLQGEQAGENNVTDLQRVGQFIRLKTRRERR